MSRKPKPVVRFRGMCPQGRPIYERPEPAGAAVGVEGVIAEMRAWVRAAEVADAGPYPQAWRTVVVQEFIAKLEAALAQQPEAVGGDWRKKAAEWLEAKAVEQEAANQRWPKHAACYKEWRDRPGTLRHLAFQVLAAQPGGSDNG